MRPLDFPNNVQIQTTAFCNASCGFCPYPETSRTLPMGTMDDDLFRAIVDQASLEDLLAREGGHDGTHAGAATQQKVAGHLRQMHDQQPDDLKLNLLRPGRKE